MNDKYRFQILFLIFVRNPVTWSLLKKLQTVVGNFLFVVQTVEGSFLLISISTTINACRT